MRWLVNFDLVDGNLRITPHTDPVDQGDIQEASEFADLIEWQLCNGWEVVQPEEIGALTAGLLLSQDVERDDHGKLKRVGRVYWHHSYETVDELAELKAGRSVTFVGRGRPSVP